MDLDSLLPGAGRIGLGGHLMLRRQIAPHNSIRHIAAAAPTGASVPEPTAGDQP